MKLAEEKVRYSLNLPKNNEKIIGSLVVIFIRINSRNKNQKKSCHLQQNFSILFRAKSSVFMSGRNTILKCPLPYCVPNPEP